MSVGESNPSLNGNDRPILVFKIGILGCVPLDAPQEIAKEIDATYISNDQVRLEEAEKREARGAGPTNPKEISGRVIKNKLNGISFRNLNEGNDVVLDAFYNSVKSRALLHEIASSVGALTVGLWIDTPYDLIIQRLEQWTEEDTFTIPVSQWRISPVASAKTTMKSIQRPESEAVNYIFKIDGTQDTDGIVDQFMDYLEKYDLSGDIEA